MLKFLLKLILWIVAIFGTLLGISYMHGKKSPKYIDIYSDADETEDDDDNETL